MTAFRGAILDAHMHAWELGHLTRPWTAARPGFDAQPLAAYRAAIAGTSIHQAMLVEADVLPHQRSAEAADFSAHYQRGAIAGAVACCDPRDPDAAQHLHTLAQQPGIRGIRWIARTPADAADLVNVPHARENFRLLGQLHLVFDLNLPPNALDLAATIASNAPNTQFVLDHCGNADPAAFGCPQARPPRHAAATWLHSITRLAACSNVMCKISGIVSNLQPGSWTPAQLQPIIDHCLNSFGPHRVLFASDWPVCTFGGTLSEWLAAADADTAHLSVEARANFFSTNAQRAYGLATNA